MRKNTGFAIAVTLLVVGTILWLTSELVADIRAPRSSLAKKQAIEASLSVRTADFHRAEEDMKRKWGPHAQTSIGASGVLTTTVDGKVVQQSSLPAQFYDLSGIFVV